MDDSRDLDLDRLMERIRLNLHERRQAMKAGPAPGPAAAQSEDERLALERDFRTLHGKYDIAGIDLNPNRRIFGRTLRRTARFIAELLKPMIRQQTEYNAANTRVTDRLNRQVEVLFPQYMEIRAMTEQALARNLAELKAQGDAVAQRYVKLHADDIAMHGQAISNLTQRFAALEQRHADLERQAARADLLEQWRAEQQRQSRQIELLTGQHTELREELGRLDIASQLRDLTQRVEALAQHDTLLNEQERRLSEQERHRELSDTRFSELVERIDLISEAQSRAESLAGHREEEFRLMRERVWRAERRLRRMLNAENGVSGIAAQPELETPPPPIEIDYAGFEERMRSSAQVKVKQSGYVDYFAGKAPVVEVGCGRGEFLELMREAGIEAVGLDQDLDMTLLCREKGLEVVNCDALDYLGRQPDAALGGIFSAQVIEHMTPAQLSALITLSHRKLRHGGIIVLETLNPESLFVHYKWFWMDPSHVRLVHPQTLTFLLESTGFVEVSCRLTSPPDGVLRIPPLPADGSGPVAEFNRATDYLNQLIFADQEYFVVARK